MLFPEPIPPVSAYETGSNEWRSYQSWPPADNVTNDKLYLQAGGKLSFAPPRGSDNESGGYDEYISDPAKPVPYRVRPIRPSFTPQDYETWRWWLYAWGPRRGVSAEQAAVYLLLDAWRAEQRESQIGPFLCVNDCEDLSIDEIYAIARRVWPGGKFDDL